MEKKFNRNIILHVNKFQQQILYPVLISCAIACIVTIFCFIFLLAKITDTDVLWNIDIKKFEMLVPWMMMFIAYVLLFIVFWTYHTSNKLVGPYERILRELDEVVAGTRKTPIGTRKGDALFEELLKRINVLIEKLK